LLNKTLPLVLLFSAPGIVGLRAKAHLCMMPTNARRGKPRRLRGPQAPQWTSLDKRGRISRHRVEEPIHSRHAPRQSKNLR
jgi:hypothetical protein